MAINGCNVGIGFGVAALGIGAATVLILTEPDAPKPTTGAAGRWAAAGVLDMGPSGAVLGVGELVASLVGSSLFRAAQKVLGPMPFASRTCKNSGFQ